MAEIITHLVARSAREGPMRGGPNNCRPSRREASAWALPNRKAYLKLLTSTRSCRRQMSNRLTDKATSLGMYLGLR
jgi:hypothetical protein